LAISLYTTPGKVCGRANPNPSLLGWRAPAAQAAVLCLRRQRRRRRGCWRRQGGVLWVEALRLQRPRLGFRFPAPCGEKQSVATSQAARGWARPPCRHFKIQSCFCVGSAFEEAAFQTRALLPKTLAEARPCRAWDTTRRNLSLSLFSFPIASAVHGAPLPVALAALPGLRASLLSRGVRGAC
jgi:hypothetical protein